jgi:hypothetical protein
MTHHLSQIDSSLKKLTELLATLPKVESVLLLGSAARDELSFLCHTGGRIELFSDYEFLIVTSTRPSHTQLQTLHTRVTELEAQIANPNPLFHIDLMIRERQRLSKLPSIIFTYEMKQNGRLLHGEDVRSEIPEVTLRKLDLRNTNEILYKRLWAILLYLPRRFVLGQMSEPERRVTGYVLSRNALDIPTVLLPHENILLPTYHQRVDRLVKSYQNLSLAKRFGPDLPRFLEECLARRLTLDFNDIDLETWYDGTIGYLQLALKNILAKEQPIAEILPMCSSAIFNEWPISRGEWYNLARLTGRFLRTRGPFVAFRWLQASKKGWLTVGLISMHKALIAWQKGDKSKADQELDQARAALEQIAINDLFIPEVDFLQRWFILRQHWGDFWRAYIRLGDPKYLQRFATITQWQND